ncbi:MAG: hypothetical protein R2838_19435 [Caldilineaceae bacterium]
MAIISGVVAGAVMIVLSWMGTPAGREAAPAAEVVQELMPEEGAGLVVKSATTRFGRRL